MAPKHSADTSVTLLLDSLLDSALEGCGRAVILLGPDEYSQSLTRLERT